MLLVAFFIQWLEKEFLPYLDKWEHSVNQREGFSDAQKKRMLLSAETLLGLRRTGMSICSMIINHFTNS